MLFVYHRSFGSKTPKIQQRRTLARAGTTLIVLPCVDDILDAAKSMVVGNQKVLNIMIGQSFCHPKDQFCRKIGMKKAQESMEKFAFVTVAVLANVIDGSDNKTKLLLVDVCDKRRGVEIDFNVFENYYRVKVVAPDQPIKVESCGGKCGC